MRGGWPWWYDRTMKRVALLLSFLPAAAWAGDAALVSVSARFVPASRPGTEARVLVSLVPRDATVRVNEDPAPRLKLDPAQVVLEDRQRPSRKAAAEEGPPRYLDPLLPVAFPVALRPGAPKGDQAVKAAVSYFYCSKSEGWCRKGTNDLEFSVRVP
jgi:hypothetical protein